VDIINIRLAGNTPHRFSLCKQNNNEHGTSLIPYQCGEIALMQAETILFPN